MNINNSLVLPAYISHCRQLLKSNSCSIDVFYFDEIVSDKKNYHDISDVVEKIFSTKFSKDKIKDDQFDLEVSELLKEFDGKELEVLSLLCNLIKSTVRTNYYQDSYKDYISLKFDGKMLSKITNNSFSSFVETFVFSENFEGVHIRNAKISRGGIRWSNRDDYRNEAFQLAFTQHIKNVVVVPGGAKGCFVIKNNSSNKDYVIEYYQKYLSGILDVTDNIVNGNVIKPDNTICYDENDYYVVAAADKGTGSFSDYANKVSQDRLFWLDDAFASGGSNGYSHKNLGITSAGAWESVKFQLNTCGLDINKEVISVVGIGDMSGDVFGNGMLYSKNIKLVAAFNHTHIFVDPNPDIEESFIERKRLFNEVKNWDAYDEKKLSEGGAIYSRKNNILNISDQVVKLLNLNSKEISESDLIKSILMLKVDLLWNGGIGTFFKSTQEDDESILDSNNDQIRINACQIGAKVVGEGGNLGMTGAARIEYCNFGGSVMSDAVDNSAGVTCSDYEVNIKILLNQLANSGKVKREEIRPLIVNIENDVIEKVLYNNIAQPLSCLRDRIYSESRLSNQRDIIKLLEKDNLINRKSSCLPTDLEFESLIENKKSLFAPQIATIISAVKMLLKKNSLNSNIQKSQIKDIVGVAKSYFPNKITTLCSDDDLLSHPLIIEIIINQLTNSFVNVVGTDCFELISKTNNIFRLLKMYAGVFLENSFSSVYSGILYNDDLKIFERTLLLDELSKKIIDNIKPHL